MKLIGALFLTLAYWLGSQHSAVAQSSPYLTAKDPSRTYFRLKKSYGRIPAEYFENEPQLASCISASELYGIEIRKNLPLTNALSELAFDVLWIEGALRIGGYPRELWSEDLNAIERNALARLQNLNGANVPETLIPEASRTALAHKMNEYRKSHPGKLRVQPNADGCGDMMGPELDIRTNPKATRIQYMSQHLANLCKDQGFDYSDNRCGEYWQDYTEHLMIRGKFVFAFRWASGPPTYRQWDLDKVKSSDRGATLRLDVSQ